MHVSEVNIFLWHWSKVTQILSSSTFLNISSETTGPIKIKLHADPPWDAGMKTYSNDPGHMTKRAAIPINVNNI